MTLEEKLGELNRIAFGKYQDLTREEQMWFDPKVSLQECLRMLEKAIKQRDYEMQAQAAAFGAPGLYEFALKTYNAELLKAGEHG